MVFVPLTIAPDALDPTGGLWFLVRDGRVLVVDDGTGFAIPRSDRPTGPPGAPVGARPIFLGLADGAGAWAVGVDEADAEPADGLFLDLRRLWGQIPDEHWTVAGRAVQLAAWDRDHRYCGRCAAATEDAIGERAKRCPRCGLLAFPRLAPAVIVLVERGDEVLLARGRNFGTAMYSTLAGFVEPGETLEQAVHREVSEEVGVELADVRYFGSQPWPFPHSLMVGFLARWAGGDIVIDEEEIADARWFPAGALPAVPPRMSIARLLIDDWLARVGPPD